MYRARGRPYISTHHIKIDRALLPCSTRFYRPYYSPYFPLMQPLISCIAEKMAQKNGPKGLGNGSMRRVRPITQATMLGGGLDSSGGNSR